MPRKIISLYADFETLVLETPKGYKNYMHYMQAEPKKAKKPEIYSWSIGYKYGEKVFKNFSTYGSIEKFAHEDKKFQGIYGIRGESFIQAIEKIKMDCVIYFNNSKGFDAHYIIPLLDKAGYMNVLPFNINEIKELPPGLKKIYKKRLEKVIDNIENDPVVKKNLKKLEKMPNSQKKYLAKLVRKKWKHLMPGEYSLMVNKNSQVYEIKIGLDDYKVRTDWTSNRVVTIRDNLLLFPASVKQMGKTVVDYHLARSKVKGTDYYLWTKKQLQDRFCKKELSTNYTRNELYRNLKELQNDGNELEYLIQDIYTLFSFHGVIEQYFPRNKWKLTIGATSYKVWLTEFAKVIIDHYINIGEVEVVVLKRRAKRYKFTGKNTLYTSTAIGKILIAKLLPTEWLDKDNNFDKIQKYTNGGIVRVNEKYRGKYVKNVTWSDLNSSYPAQMSKDTPVPVGEPVIGDSKAHPFKFYKITVTKKIKNKNGLPFMYDSNSDIREYQRILKPGQVFYITSISYPRFIKYYNPPKNSFKQEVEFSFKQMPIKFIFGEFVAKWYAIKEQASKDGNTIVKMIAKLFLNNVFGKLATFNVRDSKIWNQLISEWEDYSEVLPSKYYLPIGAVITELGRMDLVDAVDYMHKDFVYADTDSIAIIDFDIKNHPHMELDPTKLGAWDIELAKSSGIARRPKQYYFKGYKGNKKAEKFAFAGINAKRPLDPNDPNSPTIMSTIKMEDMIYGRTIPNQLTPYRVLGCGVLLEPIEKSIKPVWCFDYTVVNSRGKPIINYPMLQEQIYVERQDFNETDTLERISV